MPKAFYRTTLTIDVVSDEPIGDDLSLETILAETDDGSMVGGPVKRTSHVLTPKQAADALYEFGSHPEFFDIDANGDSIEQPDGD